MPCSPRPGACLGRPRPGARSPEQATRVRRLFRSRTPTTLSRWTACRGTPSTWSQGLINLRDQICCTACATPGSGTTDHVTAAAEGGPTSAANGQGLCEDCNLTKETPGWRHTVTSGPLEPHHVQITTPTGHTHHSRAPDSTRARADWIQIEPGRWILAA
ncbi:MAG: HNH endonuclease [Nocardioides sp.]|nr:HNH endonuclease [Nocardioides sp.]